MKEYVIEMVSGDEKIEKYEEHNDNAMKLKFMMKITKKLQKAKSNQQYK
ncbi:hypothetical protein [Fusobacterium sp. PH5-44]